ncbi:MAG: esterase-like activity of phytase family protein, partial [Proteobacteria bacterium]
MASPPTAARAPHPDDRTAMRVWGFAALVWVASCSDGDTDKTGGPSGASSSGAGDASASSSGTIPGGDSDTVVVHAVVDLPRTARTRTLSGLTGEGPHFYAVPDKDRRIVGLTANADYTGFEIDDGTVLTGLVHPTWDGEGIARAPDGSFYLVADETAPNVVHVSAEGAFLAQIPVPGRYAGQPRNNKGLESLSIAPSGAFLFSCNESALTTDGVAATKTQGTVVRILRLAVGQAGSREYAYRTESLGAGSGGDMGVSEVHA